MEAPRAFSLGDVVVDPMANAILATDGTRRVTSREMDVLVCLADGHGAVVSRETILDAVWQETVVLDESVTLAISRLRKALGDDPKHPRYIETIPTRGYRLLETPGPPSGQTGRPSRRSGRPRVASVLVPVLSVLVLVLLALFLQVRSEYGKLTPDADTVQAP